MKQVHFLSIMAPLNLRDVLFKEVYSNRLLIVSGKNALAVALNHTGFTHSSIAYDYHLKY